MRLRRCDIASPRPVQRLLCCAHRVNATRSNVSSHLLAIGLGLALAITAVTALHSATKSSYPAGRIVIGHRGASGYLPEHTLESYALAHGQGADYIEPDLVRTKDGAFICLHDIYLDATTDVATAFPGRARADGRYYAADFTLEEVRRMRVHERLDRRFPRGVSRFSVPTFEEMIELVAGLNRTTGRRAGIYPELKQPAFHRAAGMPMEEAFLEIVRRHGVGGPDAPADLRAVLRGRAAARAASAGQHAAAGLPGG